MSDRERTVYAAVVAPVGASMLVGGLFAQRGAGLLSTVGWVLVVLGVLAVANGVAASLGLWTPPDARKPSRRCGRRDR